MGQAANKILHSILKQRRQHRRFLAMVLVFAMLVTSGAGWGLQSPAEALTRTDRILDCPYAVKTGEGYAGYAVHEHNKDCYDADGKLVCKLPEVEFHEHDDSCYDEEHKLTCQKKETILHKHDKNCFDDDGKLICGKLELEEHIHGPECFRDLEIEEPESETESEQVFESEPETEPEQVFESEPETEPEQVFESEPETEPEQVVESEPETEPEQVVESEPETEPEQVVESEPETESEQVFESAPEPESEPVAEQKPATEPELVAEPEQIDKPEVTTEQSYGNETVVFFTTGTDETNPADSGAPSVTEPKPSAENSDTSTQTGEPENHSHELGPEKPTESQFFFLFDESEEETSGTGSTPDTVPGNGEEPSGGQFIFLFDEDESENELLDSEESEVLLTGETEQNVETEPEAVNTEEVRDETGEDEVIGDNPEAEDAAESEENDVESSDTEPVEEDSAETEESDEAEESVDAEETEENAEEIEEEDMQEEGEAESEESAENGTEPTEDLPMPATSFEEITETLTVRVEAPEGALPEGTTMTVTPVEDEETLKAVTEPVDGQILQVFAVDITFLNANGEEIEPLKPIRVEMVPTAAANESGEAESSAVSAQLPENHIQTVVHLDGEGNTSVMEQDESASVEEETVSFEAESFSVYAMIYSVIEKTVLASDGETYRITLNYGPEAGIPYNAELEVIELLPGTEEYMAYAQMADDSMESEMLAFARFFDITIVADGEEIQPAAPVEVKIELADALDESVKAVHFGDEVEMIEVAAADITNETIDGSNAEENNTETLSSEVSFTAEGFSVYGVVLTTLEKTISASDGNTYDISVSYHADAKLPMGAELTAEEILSESEAYEGYLASTADTLDIDTETITYARFFDISILADGEAIQPADDTTVSVVITLADREVDIQPQVVHFGEEAEVLSVETEGNTVSFEANGFSVYAIIEAPEPVKTEIMSVSSLNELAADTPYYFSYKGTAKYISSSLNKNSAFIEVNDVASAAVWFLEAAEDGEDGQYTIYTVNGEEKEYVQNTSGNLVGLGEEGTLFTLSEASEGTFYFKSSSEKKWLQHSKSGDGIRFYTDINNKENSQFTITYASSYSVEDDPYGLNGKSYGIAYNNDTANAVALTSTSQIAGSKARMAGQELLIRPNVLDNSGNLLMAQNSDLTMWEFESVKEDCYYVKATVDGTVGYLTFNGENITFEAEPDETNSLIKLTPGTGEHQGKWRLTANGYSLNLAGKAADGFNGSTGMGETTWLCFVEKSVLKDDDFVLYTAKKVSASDTTNLFTGQEVLIYTRIWNDTSKRYEFYAVDSDGSLVRCYDTGDNIEWIDSKINTALWDFTEYTNDDGTPSYYYELRNTQYKNYLSPKVTDGSVMSSNPIGINLNGRRYGENYTTIIAWDDDNYAYTGLKTENGRVVACPLSEAEDFYFAKVVKNIEAGVLTEVNTIDSAAFGITMRMVDFNNKITNGRDSVQSSFFGVKDNNIAGLLSTDLNDAGYPTTTSATGMEQPLSNLFQGLKDVNYLFIESIYNESGYFEYDSTQNFAHLNKDGSFTVYDQLLAVGKDSGPTRTHGQFLPYNEIDSTKIASVETNKPNFTNQTDVTAEVLPDTNPRKGEELYWVSADDADYFFGMEMEASFTQTADGLDAWGHDIIFEFSGDDDFWLYVDGELVLDLGGVHPAMTGSINFRTGDVKSSRGNSTLYEVFKSNYQSRGLSADSIKEKLDLLFTKNSAGQYVFKDYTKHTMKMFYMERGAGASNLHMRFNLAAVQPGTVVLSKKLSGTENPANNLIEFPYQVFYRTQADGPEDWRLFGAAPEDAAKVTYKDIGTPMTIVPSFTPVKGTVAYENVIFLKPGESAVIDLPDDTVDYYIVECGVNPLVYDVVKANSVALTGTSTENPEREDYAIKPASMENRPQVDFDNHVSDEAVRTLSITKMLYDANGSDRLSSSEDGTTFSFRLYLGNENKSEDALPLANQYSYYVKNTSGNYCRWDAKEQRFVSLEITDYEQLLRLFDEEKWTNAQKENVIFKTSMNGSISKIPADYTVEVRDLIAGTQYKVEERENEIPKGYTLRLSDGYTSIINDKEVTNYNIESGMCDPVNGTIAVNDDPKVQIRNQKGWGLTARKIWTDQDFMASHDDIYFAVYLNDTLIENTVRRLASPDTELYYFFDDLKFDGKIYTFENFAVREVKLEGDAIFVDRTGAVSGYQTVTPIEAGGTLEIGGTPAGGVHQDGYTYAVNYRPGVQTAHNENVRTDTVINSRPGVAIYKTDWVGNDLPGAVFTLKNLETGLDVAAASYTSGQDGLVTIAYLSPGTYVLKETATPKGFIALDKAAQILVDNDGRVSVIGIDESYVTVDTDNPDSSMAAIITVRNKTSVLNTLLVDMETREPIPNAAFALYHQVIDNDGKPVRDYLPIKGYEAILTDENGIVANVTMDLPAGTYYLVEVSAADGYLRPEDELCFTIGTDGTVRLENTLDWAALSSEGTGAAKTRDVGGNVQVAYTITLTNGKALKKLSFKKVDIQNPDSALRGAEFDLYQVTEDVRAEEPLFRGLSSDANGLLVYTSAPSLTGPDEEAQTVQIDEEKGTTVFELEDGIYELIETKAPNGYMIKTTPVKIVITPDGVSYNEGTTLSGPGEPGEDGVITLLISNAAGSEMPETGGHGVTVFYLAGIMLTLTAAAVLVLRRKREETA